MLKIPLNGDLLPANPFLTINKKISGELTAAGRFSLQVQDATVKIGGGLLQLEDATVKLNNKGLSFRGKWLGETILFTIKFGPPLEITSETRRNFKIEEELRFSLKNPMGGSIDIGKIDFSARVEFAVKIKTKNEQLDLAVTASFYFLQKWKFQFSIKTPPLSDADFLELLRELVIDELIANLSPDRFFALMQRFALEPMMAAMERLGSVVGSAGLKGKAQFPRSYLRFNSKELIFHLESGALNFDVGIRVKGNEAIISQALSYGGPAVAAAIAAIAMIDSIFPWAVTDALKNFVSISGRISGAIYSGAKFHLDSSSLHVRAFFGLFKLDGSAKFDDTYMEIVGEYKVIDYPILKIGGSGFYALKLSGGLPDISFGGRLGGSTGAFGFKTGASSKMEARNVISPQGVLTVEADFTMIDTPLFQLAGKAKFTLLMSGKMSLYGDANAGTMYIKLAEATVSAENIGADTKISIAGKFNIDAGVLKINGELSGSADAMRRFSLSGKVSAVTGSFKVAAGRVTLSNSLFEYRSSWLGKELILRVTDSLVMTGRLYFDFPIGVSLPSQSATDKIGVFPGFGFVQALSINPQVVCHIDVTVEPSRFEARVGGYIDYYGRIHLPTFTIAASTDNLTKTIDQIKKDIIKNKMSYFAGEIARMYNRARNMAYNMAKDAYDEARKKLLGK